MLSPSVRAMYQILICMHMRRIGDIQYTETRAYGQPYPSITIFNNKTKYTQLDSARTYIDTYPANVENMVSS
jgi:hypothetical protein